ncbi:MAG: hypothetical protein BGN91_04580 [Nitrobacter sp. 62-13]|uniref:hypothetical protein n=1 Tax=Nitrobacter sp. 62-13 TaxID=1895797 RepID=UPI00095B1D01|nr:hypothetical protein [Nitrobacter sp. 62-13]OJU25468.1 MAG: hypothetical protein BGN91_04580 [Nitrobacter sp. 62-13]
MLDIRIDLVPGGSEPLRRTIATMRIANRSNLADLSNYSIDATEGRNVAGLPARRVSITIQNHDRRQSVWRLIEKAAAATAQAEGDQL